MFFAIAVPETSWIVGLLELPGVSRLGGGRRTKKKSASVGNCGNCWNTRCFFRIQGCAELEIVGIFGILADVIPMHHAPVSAECDGVG